MVDVSSNKLKTVGLFSFLTSYMLVIAVYDLPYDYYTFLRLVVFSTSVYIGYLYFKLEKPTFAFVFLGLAIIFNPIFPLYLSKFSWILIDLISSIAFFSSGYLFTSKKGVKFLQINAITLLDNLKGLLKDRISIITFLKFVAIVGFLLFVQSSIFWIVFFGGILLLSILLKVVQDIPIQRSLLFEFGIAAVLFVLLIIFVSIRDTYFQNRMYSYYKGGYAPDGAYCDYGYKRATEECCDGDDYSCEMCDTYGKYCNYKGVYQGE